ncbi:hypothetical protein ACFOY8_14335 [Thalassospira xianhensis]|uniref:hypothetical protein n=1 Tax=Thalassospira xianhensis TaxID=478503 RepID=UPI0011BDF79E|nr:hypothetical protein [Thalassospira xianhensis]
MLSVSTIDAMEEASPVSVMETLMSCARSSSSLRGADEQCADIALFINLLITEYTGEASMKVDFTQMDRNYRDALACALERLSLSRFTVKTAGHHQMQCKLLSHLNIRGSIALFKLGPELANELSAGSETFEQCRSVHKNYLAEAMHSSASSG